LTPYLFAGAGATYMNTSRDWTRLNTAYFAEDPQLLAGLAVDAARTLPKIIPVIPVGVGLRYAITPTISINAETNYRVTFTDYVDGFSFSANPDKRDHYHSHTIGIIYRFGRKNTLDCPVVRP
jgi:opacity protein-like surface antigen